MKNSIVALALVIGVGGLPAAWGQDHAAQKRVFFENLKDGDVVSSPVSVKMGVEGMTIAPAGEVKEASGHHHLIIDGGPIKAGEAVPADAQHLHFGKGQTEANVDLAPGKHRLTLQFADGAHRSYGPEMSADVAITVK